MFLSIFFLKKHMKIKHEEYRLEEFKKGSRVSEKD